MSDLVRLSFSIDSDLCQQLETLVKNSHYKNRSEFVRDMIRDKLVEQEWKHDREVVGTLTIVYDHEAHRVVDKLIKVQHQHHSAVLVTTHVHLDEHTCVEVTILRGSAGELRQIADLIKQQRGVLHAALSLSSTGRNLTAHSQGHSHCDPGSQRLSESSDR